MVILLGWLPGWCKKWCLLPVLTNGTVLSEMLAFALVGVEVVVADMLDLPFERESFDLVIEKGTMVRVLLKFDFS